MISRWRKTFRCWISDCRRLPCNQPSQHCRCRLRCQVGGGEPSVLTATGKIEKCSWFEPILNNSFHFYSSTLRSPSTVRAGTREVHNKLEKNRRAHLKECFEALKKQLPITPDEKKTSNLSILGAAIRHIQVRFWIISFLTVFLTRVFFSFLNEKNASLSMKWSVLQKRKSPPKIVFFIWSENSRSGTLTSQNSCQSQQTWSRWNQSEVVSWSCCYEKKLSKAFHVLNSESFQYLNLKVSQQQTLIAAFANTYLG